MNFEVFILIWFKSITAMKIALFILSLFCTTLTFAQNEVSTIYWGNTILDFRVSPFQVLSTSAVSSKESGASICDSVGNLLFYSNGGTSPTSSTTAGAWGANGQYLQNGQNLSQLGCFSTQQGAIVLPDPSGISATSKKYYLLTEDCLEAISIDHTGLSYGVIDMLANGGNGAVISQSNIVVPFLGGGSTNWEPLNVVLDTDGEQKSGTSGYWVYAYQGDSLYKIHFGVNGFDSFQKLFKEGGRIIVAPDRKHMMIKDNLYDLDAPSGNLVLIHTFSTTRDGVFSSDGRKIFRAENNKLMQYDLDQPNWQNSPYEVSSFSQNVPQFFLVPSGRIFLWNNNSSFSGQIMCPNVFGPNCDYTASNLSLQGGTLTAPPNIPAHYLYRTSSPCSLGLSEQEANKFTLAPNPSEGIFSVYLNTNLSKLTIRIIDLTGRILQMEDVSGLDGKDHLDIQTENIQNGEYFLELTQEGKEPVLKRFVIQH